jgi:hypothetical protein
MEEMVCPKGQLLLLLSNQQGEFLSNDKEFKTIQNYEELMKIIQEINEDPNENIFKFIFSFRSLIHECILYNEEQTIKIDNFKLKNEFDEYYYLSELIKDNEEIVNYEYDFEFIKKYYELLKLIKIKKGNKLQKIVSYKILYELINNFCGNENYDEDINGEDIEKYKIEIDEIISQNIDVFKELNLESIYVNEDSIKSAKLENIYCDIINSLIKQNRFGDYDYIYSLCCNEMDLDNIRIGKAIIPSLQQTLNKSNDYMKAYIIQSKEDLYNELRINFYYILLKYVLKDQIFIYHNDFLIETRNIILNMIKLHKISYNNLKKEILERLKYVLEAFAGSKHYFEDSEEIKKEILKLKEILNYYQFYFFESKKEDIELLEKNIELGEKFEYEKYLTDLEKSKNMNDRYPIIKFIFEKNSKGNEMTEKELQKTLKSFESNERPIKDGKKSKISRQIKKPMVEYFNIKENEKILLKIFTQEQINQYKKKKMNKKYQMKISVINKKK